MVTDLTEINDDKTLFMCYKAFKESLPFEAEYLKDYQSFQNAIAMSHSKQYTVIKNGVVHLYIRYSAKDLVFEILDLYINRKYVKLKDVYSVVRHLLLNEGYYPFIVYKHTKKNKLYIVFHDFNDKFVIKQFHLKED